MGKRYFSDKIVKWYLENRRPLPWRDTTDPYKIWLSEVILQQTRVAQGLPYYHQFVHNFPTIHHLAGAAEQQVLRVWQGLGYYTRARNLHKCAQKIVSDHQGVFPSTSEALGQLPGIGPYTAAAIASFAFGERVAVVDGNVFRILSRIFGVDTAINTPEGRKTFTALANELISDHSPALHNQATMEFGAMYCTPSNPQCHECPFKRSCYAFNHELVDALPVKVAAKPSRRRYFYYIVVERNKSLLMKQRQSKDIWHGLFDFPLIEKDRQAKPKSILTQSPYFDWLDENSGIQVSDEWVHTLTHQTIHCRFIRVKARRGFKPDQDNLSFYSMEDIAELPKPVLISRFLSRPGP